MQKSVENSCKKIKRLNLNFKILSGHHQFSDRSLKNVQAGIVNGFCGKKQMFSCWLPIVYINKLHRPVYIMKRKQMNDFIYFKFPITYNTGQEIWTMIGHFDRLLENFFKKPYEAFKQKKKIITCKFGFFINNLIYGLGFWGKSQDVQVQFSPLKVFSNSVMNYLGNQFFQICIEK